MKKVLFIVCLIPMLLCGCKKEEGTSEIILNTSEELEKVKEEISYIPPEYTIPTSAKDLYALTLDEFKEVVNYNIPNYREFFKIDADMELTDADWETMREILSLHLFGEIYYEDVETSIQVEEIGEDAVFVSPTKEFFEGLDTQGMIDYLTGLYEYLNPDGMPVDFSELTPEQLEEIRQEFIKDFS